MPEVRFEIEWPDGEVTGCYSPSTIVRSYFHDGMELTIARLRTTMVAALGHAARRVERRYGFECSAAHQQLEEILDKAQRFADERRVRILRVGK